MREYHLSDGYNLRNELIKLAALLAIPALSKKEVVQSLEAGDNAAFSLRGKGPFEVQADPANGLKIVDKGKKALEIAELQKMVRQPEKVKTIRLVKSPDQSRSQGLGYE